MVENKRTRRIRGILWYLFGALAAVCTVYPFLWMIATSFKETVEIYARPLSLIPTKMTVENYQSIIETVPFFLYFRNSFILATAGVLTNVFLGALAGYGFAKLKFTGKNALFKLLGIVLLFVFITITAALGIYYILGRKVHGLSI